MSRRTIPVLAVLLLCASLIPAASAAGRAGAYIVVLHDGEAPRAVAAEHARGGARIGHIYDDALNGYSATMSDTAAARIANDSRVAYVVSDGEAHKTAVTQSPVTWGLDRIDERARDSASSYTYEATGAGIKAYVIDSGVWNHADFDGRLTSGVDYVDDGTSSDDCDGHGTHVAGTIGSETWGVAKDVSLVGVRVLDCSGSGSWSDVIAGIDWVTNRHSTVGGPSVANMSLGGGANQAVDDAVARSTAAGVVYSVSAGNGNNGGKAQDACFYSPARAPSALTVGATNSSDSKASWSNYGTCVDIFAPGVSITSTVMGGGTDTWSGTSMASPHVAGVAALYLEANPAADAATTASAITGQATTGLVVNAGAGSPNRLLYSLFGTITSPANNAPVANNDSASTPYQTAVAVNVLGNDIDADDDTLSVSSVTQPASGTGSVTQNADQTVTYTPPAGYSGTTNFTYVASDGTATSNTATVTVTVAADTSTPPPTGLTLSATGYKVKGKQKADLTWSGAGGSVDIYRDSTQIASGAAGSGTMTDHIDRNGNGTYVYKVCEVAAPTVCAQVTVSFN